MKNDQCYHDSHPDDKAKTNLRKGIVLIQNRISIDQALKPN